MPSTTLLAAHVPRASAGSGTDAALAGSVILAAILFNPVLAIVNGHVMGLSSKIVIAAEVAIVGLALVLTARRFTPAMTPWLVMMALAGVFALLRTLGTGSFEPKYLRDVMLIPVFVMLGMTVRPDRLGQTIGIATAITVAGMLVEGFRLDWYRDLFKVQDYYSATRGVSPEDFWDQEVGLYPSAVREDRLLAFVDVHRLSSVFLEPVSLGNFAAILMTYVLACHRWLSARMIVFLVLAGIALLVGCDGRLAFVGLFLILAVAALSPLLPPYSAVLFLPFAIVAVCLATWIGGFNHEGNDFPSRLAHTVWLLESYGPMEYLGLSDAFAAKAVDSGIAYLIYTQSALGVAAVWIMLTLSSRHETGPQVRYLNGIAVYVCATMLVSASFASIKTAALMWFILGALQNDGADRQQTRQRSG
ncbi:MAG: hypothetical protein NW217_05365 [Hyphomicrobiaceae bacterium]|nr:hypothetical protein [Hyphomicrobiaceae bacterium]